MTTEASTVVSEFEQRVRDNFSRQAFMNTLGAEMVAVGRGAVEIRLPFSSKLTQQHGYVHAGAITSVLDSACGYAVLSLAPEGSNVLTVEFKVNLLSPAIGEYFVAKGKVKRAGKTLSVCTGDVIAVSTSSEKVVATMLATIFIVPA